MQYEIITCASSGIGLELASIIAEKGHHLILVARREDRLLALKTKLESQFNIKVMIVVMDLSIPNQAKILYQYCIDQNLTVNCLVNNAGYGINNGSITISSNGGTGTRNHQLFIKDTIYDCIRYCYPHEHEKSLVGIDINWTEYLVEIEEVIEPFEYVGISVEEELIVIDNGITIVVSFLHS
jgi:hypothetical protein